MKFPPTHSSIQHVDTRHYDDLIETYVQKVSCLDGVLGVVKFGSVSTPGLSDIDLVVKVSENGPWPEWNKISLRAHARNHPAESVLAHDVFVWPESVAKQAEAFFYIDHQTVLTGKPLGGSIDQGMKKRLQGLMAMDYLLHRFESLASLLIAPQASLRNLLLFISTLRHSCKLAAETGALSQSENENIVSDISDLRQSALDGSITVDSLNIWPRRLVQLLWQLTISLGRHLGVSLKTDIHSWASSRRNIFVNSNLECGIDLWEKSIAAQVNRWPSKYVRIAPIPSIACQHVREYYQSKSASSEFLSDRFASIYRNQSSNTPCAARQLRAETVIQHWGFIQQSGYRLSSGIGYLGISAPFRKSLKSCALQQFAYFNEFLLRKSLR